ncbi:electron transfer flavoprotein subunit alpha/FixB family protein [Shouchella clausii]|uniref:Electron transfer flavoprotein subunit alpha n=1 Tax=Shouchella clausii TaxID=79880 RepID=A0A268S2W0_SHOCL|nr:electron transfer flavoprotein subunit alpha/FixB family protein [Shouchella clausii]PAD41937.1 electron transfer flavoprotein subunit alpha [Bacillus sp. 7520-S]SPU20927.1 electron transfer flavoprotein alpha subunit [Niallia circulans]AST97059.1 electron transfer flavoprotein subunit alpha [Shouchella clausii]MBU8594598.1 electron transfer flavoprotein subunit alpha/FixB family protein [Shouchella clausii]MCM3547441.1 electron transfer flavoprotein subunit alpha/FixB family protein [Shouc
MAKKTIVLAEAKNNELRNVSFEAIAAAKELADGGEVTAVLAGEAIASLGEQLFQYGADRVIVVEHPELANYTTDAYKQAYLQVFDKENPDIVVLGHTSVGKDLSPRLAVKLDGALFSDVVAIEAGDTPVFTRPIYSGKAFEKRKAIDEGPYIVTIRPNNIAALAKEESASGEVETLSVDIHDLRTIVKDVVKKATGGVDLSEANIIVAGGRGVKSADGFKPLQELADLLGGAVGASRGACDAEYCDYSLQIGQTGKVVTPDLYIAVGLSGAIQHLAGMSNSKVIVAINKDPEAPIFEVADYGIVGDLFEIVPLLTEELKAVLVSK